jgi:hypothetical protein
MVEAFTPQKSANATNKGWIYYFVDGLDLKQCWKKLLMMQIEQK